MKDIFISYSHKDQTKVNRIVDQLRDKGYSILFDENFSAGECWNEKALEYILTTRCAIFFISKNSLISEPVLIELQVADKEKERGGYYYFAVLLDNMTIQDMYIKLKQSDDVTGAQIKTAFKIYDKFPDNKLYILNDDYCVDRIIDSLNKNNILPSQKVEKPTVTIVDGKRVDSYITSNYSLFNIEKEISIFPIYDDEKELAIKGGNYFNDNGNALFRLAFLPTDYINNPIDSVFASSISFYDSKGDEYLSFKAEKPIDCNYSTNVLQRCYNCLCVDILTDKDICYLFSKAKMVKLVLNINSIFNVCMAVEFNIELNGQKDNSHNVDIKKIPEMVTYNIHHTKTTIIDKTINE